jgi:hypothetical protein
LAVSQGTGKVNRKGVKVDIRDSSQVSIMGGNANNPLMNECMDNAMAQLAAQFRRLGLDLKRILAFDVREDAGSVVCDGFHETSTSPRSRKEFCKKPVPPLPRLDYTQNSSSSQPILIPK